MAETGPPCEQRQVGIEVTCLVASGLGNIGRGDLLATRCATQPASPSITHGTHAGTLLGGKDEKAPDRRRRGCHARHELAGCIGSRNHDAHNAAIADEEPSRPEPAALQGRGGEDFGRGDQGGNLRFRPALQGQGGATSRRLRRHRGGRRFAHPLCRRHPGRRHFLPALPVRQRGEGAQGRGPGLGGARADR